MGKIIDSCRDFDDSRHVCLLCRKIFIKCSQARLVRCNWIPKKINVKLAQQKLF
jgi:hypothetical protein